MVTLITLLCSTIQLQQLNVNPGISVMLDGTYDSSADKIEIIPVLLGKTKSGAVKEYTCPEKIATVV